ncbi:ZBTB41 [Lepeophtheirus salmonis]|uniref:ZBTB41 n=1 Tax=Lepeophtheirus salmonis TaxID=72036 RepID=A0A7R8CMY6_LEPSM|nr:ZBTB41 [Lepeophtheirus salmonis]CAF2825205.1 ZBTB41 [Lepeophtheirus salmonis]
MNSFYRSPFPNLSHEDVQNFFPTGKKFCSRHFQLLDAIEERISRFAPHLWKGEPEGLKHFISQEEQDRERRSKAVDRMYADIEKSVQFEYTGALELSFGNTPINPDNFWNDPDVELQLNMEKEEKAQRKFLSCNATEPTQEPVIPDLDEYFQNSSPIPHIFDREEQSSIRDDFIHGIPLNYPQSFEKECLNEIQREETEKRSVPEEVNKQLSFGSC